jgi:hypothetical protein
VDENRSLLNSTPQVLCLTSSDLERYPRAVVTVTFMKEESATTKPRLLAKRHYFRTADGEYGRKLNAGKPLVVFNEDEKTVFLGFAGASGKTFYYKPIDDITLLGRVQSHTLDLSASVR